MSAADGGCIATDFCPAATLFDIVPRMESRCDSPFVEREGDCECRAKGAPDSDGRRRRAADAGSDPDPSSLDSDWSLSPKGCAARRSWCSNRSTVSSSVIADPNRWYSGAGVGAGTGAALWPLLLLQMRFGAKYEKNENWSSVAVSAVDESAEIRSCPTCVKEDAISSRRLRRRFRAYGHLLYGVSAGGSDQREDRHIQGSHRSQRAVAGGAIRQQYSNHVTEPLSVKACAHFSNPFSSPVRSEAFTNARPNDST